MKILFITLLLAYSASSFANSNHEGWVITCGGEDSYACIDGERIGKRSFSIEEGPNIADMLIGSYAKVGINDSDDIMTAKVWHVDSYINLMEDGEWVHKAPAEPFSFNGYKSQVYVKDAFIEVDVPDTFEDHDNAGLIWNHSKNTGAIYIYTLISGVMVIPVNIDTKSLGATLFISGLGLRKPRIRLNFLPDNIVSDLFGKYAGGQGMASIFVSGGGSVLANTSGIAINGEHSADFGLGLDISAVVMNIKPKVSLSVKNSRIKFLKYDGTGPVVLFR